MDLKKGDRVKSINPSTKNQKGKVIKVYSTDGKIFTRKVRLGMVLGPWNVEVLMDGDGSAGLYRSDELRKLK